MNDYEHKKHTKYTGAWLAALVIGALVFLMPILFLNSYIEPFIFLFSFGGILWVVYFSTAFLFRNYYHELAFGAIILWIFFALGIAEFNSFLLLSPTGLLPLAVAMVVLIITFGIVGTMLLFNSTKDFVVDFERGVSLLEKELTTEKKHAVASRNRARRSNRKR
jgi:4-hydroxybenzoate polyprenyltransferase